MANESELNRKPLEWLAGAFKQVDWLVPAFIPLGILHKIASDILQATEPESKAKILRAHLAQIYDQNYLAVMLLHKYSIVPFVRDFQPQLEEAVKAYFLGLRHAAVTTMIPILEGVMRSIARSQSRDVGVGTKRLLLEFEMLVERERASPNCYGERMVMLETLRDFIKARFLESTQAYAGQDEFNRHGILHGVFRAYGDELNFFRAITILDLMCFSIGLMVGGISFFVPEFTPQAAALAERYARLRNLSTS